MRQPDLTLLILTAALAAGGAGCKRQEAKVVEVTKVVDQSFKTAEPEARQVVAAAAVTLQAAAKESDIPRRREGYIQVLVPLKNMVARGNLSREQIQAIHKVFNEVAQAVQKDPRLNTKELYNAQNALAQALHEAGGWP